MSTQHTRKAFFAKFFGMLAATSVVPRLFSKPATPRAATPVSGQAPFSIQADPRSVARSGDTL